jgi:ABC-type Fe3+-hydroxamate transport system substrate-binding protein
MGPGKSYVDMLGREVIIPEKPQRIVSLVPSQTELLFDLGLDERVVGLTWFCIHPEEAVKSKTKIGGTKNLKLDKIRALKPDLIIANKEENERGQVEALAAEFPVWTSDIATVDDACEMIRRVGEITGTQEKGQEVASRIINGFSALQAASPLRTLYLIWREPYMSVGSDTFIHHTLDRIGLVNVCADRTRYPELTAEEIKALTPDMILLSSEPYPFAEKHIRELEAIVPQADIRLVDGEMFSWYGSRLLKAADYLDAFINSLSKV